LEMDRALNGPDRYVAMMVFRGGAKTTKLRLFASRKIAYALSRTILFVGKSEDAAVRSLDWLKRQVTYNALWAQTFMLAPGAKWGADEIEILHGVDKVKIRIIALGIAGSTRGINIDDYRPDLIIVDDPSDEDNTRTQDGREKTDDFINGSLRNSLAPETEAPHAKLVFLQTLLDSGDSISRCEKDPLWKFLRFSVFDEKGNSRWESRFPTETLKKEKESFIARGKLSLWLREMECVVASSELSAFRDSGLNYYSILPETRDMVTALGVDPVPPPSDAERSRGLRGKDWEVHAAVGRYRGNYYLLEYLMERGHDPEWSITAFFTLKQRWAPIKARVESIAYQRTLKWLLQKAMQRMRQWVQIDDTPTDRRKKSYRIIDVIGNLVAQGKLYVHPSQTEFIEQYLRYPNVENDDVIEAVSMALSALMDMGEVEGVERDWMEMEKEEGFLPIDIRACP